MRYTIYGLRNGEQLYAYPIVNGNESDLFVTMTRSWEDHVARREPWDKALHFGAIPMPIVERLTDLWRKSVRRPPV